MLEYKIYDCVIVGAGPGGLTAAIYLKRAGYNVKVIAGGEAGGNLTKISLIENYPGVLPISGQKLADIMLEQCNQLQIEIDYFNSVEIIDNNIATLSDKTICAARSFIIASGSIPNKLGFVNEEELIQKNYIHFCATCDGPFYKDKVVTVFGGGNSAIDFCLALSKYCSQINLIHRRDKFRADVTMQNKLADIPNLVIYKNTILNNIKEVEQKLILNCTTTFIDETKEMNLIVDGIFYALGYKPQTINIQNSTNIKYIGDCIDTKYRQVVTACGDGCKAALDLISLF